MPGENSSLTKNIITFFSTPDLTHTDVTDLHDIRNYQQGDAKRDINRKKTAQNNMLMTNVFEQEKSIHGKIVSIVSRNWDKGNEVTAYNKLETLLNSIQLALGENQWNYIAQSTIPHIPVFIDFFQQKTIIVSDFFWSHEQLSLFIQACNQGKARGLVIPLYTPLGKIQHPLCKKYPEFFWSI